MKEKEWDKASYDAEKRVVATSSDKILGYLKELNIEFEQWEFMNNVRLIIFHCNDAIMSLLLDACDKENVITGQVVHGSNANAYGV